MNEREKISSEFRENILKSVGENVKKSAPKASVVMPAYNIAEYIAESLDSVLAQTFKDYETIVINDGSLDTKELEKNLESYRDKIIYLKQENRGAGIARNIAVEHARGELVAFLDGDDVWKPDFLAAQIEFLEKNDFDMVYADAELFGGSIYDGQTFMQTAPSAGKVDFESLLDLRCNVITSGTVVRRQTIFDAGMFEWKRIRAQDFVLWLKIARSGARVGYQKKILLKYRVRPDSLSGDSVQRVRREIDVFRRVENLFELSKSQRKIINRHLERLEADLEVERGKSYLLQENFAAAKDAFQNANRYRRSNRLRLIIWLIRFAPRLFLKIYKARRAKEIAFFPK